MLSVIKGMVWTKIKNESAEPVYIIIKNKGNKILQPKETFEVLTAEKWTSRSIN